MKLTLTLDAAAIKGLAAAIAAELAALQPAPPAEAPKKDPKPEPAPEPEAGTEEGAESVVDRNDVLAALKAFKASHGKEAATAIVEKHSTSKLFSDVPDESLGAMLADIEAATKPADDSDF